MANTFRIPLLNPSRWVSATAVYNPQYNTKPFDDQTDLYGYKLPWQKNDTIYGQFYSDFTDVTGKIYKADPFHDKVFYANFDILPQQFAIVGVSFTCYQFSIPLSDFQSGVYYAEISYTDQNGYTQVQRSCLWDVQSYQPNTILYEYSNATNDKDIIFDTGIVFQMRLTGAINRYEPGSDDEQYEDQYYNVLNENSIPFRTFVNEVSAVGIGVLPDWVIDRLNLIYSLNQISIDGTYYNKFKGESFQLARNPVGPNFNAIPSIKIIPSDNLNLSKFTTTSPTEDNNIQVIVQDERYDNITESFSLGGFTGWSELIGISFINAGLNEFLLKLGTTVGGDDINPGGYETSGDATETIKVDHRFAGASTLYVTLPTGVNLNQVVLYWYQYDAPIINTPTIESPFQFGVDYYYTPRAVDGFATPAAMLAAHWNLATGLGNTGTVYEGCKIDDVTKGKVSVVWDRTAYLANPTDPTLQVGANHGNAGNSLTITQPNLPNITLSVHRNYRGQEGSSQQLSVNQGNGNADFPVACVPLGGEGVPLDISNDGVLQIKFYRVS